jgi:hypothetical protein
MVKNYEKWAVVLDKIKVWSINDEVWNPKTAWMLVSEFYTSYFILYIFLINPLIYWSSSKKMRIKKRQRIFTRIRCRPAADISYSLLPSASPQWEMPISDGFYEKTIHSENTTTLTMLVFALKQHPITPEARTQTNRNHVCSYFLRYHWTNTKQMTNVIPNDQLLRFSWNMAQTRVSALLLIFFT